MRIPWKGPFIVTASLLTVTTKDEAGGPATLQGQLEHDVMSRDAVVAYATSVRQIIAREYMAAGEEADVDKG